MSDVLTTGGGLVLGFVPVSLWRVDQAFLLECVKSMLSTASILRSLRVLSKCPISLFAVSVISSLGLASWFNLNSKIITFSADNLVRRAVLPLGQRTNSRCLHVITGEDNRTTLTVSAYNLVLAGHKRRLRYFGHVLRLPADSIVRRSLLALVKGDTHYPEGSLFRDSEAGLPQLEALYVAKVSSLT